MQRRAWILQESILPTSSTCFLGDQSFPLDHLLEVAAWLGQVRLDYLDITFVHSLGIRAAITLFDYRSRFQREEFIGLAQLLTLSGRREASNFRDLVYSTLGLSCMKDLPLKLVPDYELPLHTVLRDATRVSLLSDHDRLDALCEVHGGLDPQTEWGPAAGKGLSYALMEANAHLSRRKFKSRIMEWKPDLLTPRPSWVADWFLANYDGLPEHGIHNESVSWDAWQRLPRIKDLTAERTADELTDLMPGDEPEILILHGQLLGTINKVYDPFDFKQSALQSLNMWRNRRLTPEVHRSMQDPDWIANHHWRGCVNSHRIATECYEDFRYSALGDTMWEDNLEIFLRHILPARGISLGAEVWDLDTVGVTRLVEACNNDDRTAGVLHRLARTMIADITLDGTPLDGADMEYLAPFMKLETFGLPGGVNFSGSDCMDPYWEAVRRTCTGRRLATTENHFLLLVPERAEPGDIVVRVRGCTYPFLLRPVDDTESILIEHCYVDGAMPWQWAISRLAKPPLTTFRIR